MLGKMIGLEKMSIQQCEELAQGYSGKTTFDLCGPKGRLKAEWLDPHFGIFKLEGADGFNTVGQFSLNPDVWCENLCPADLNEPVTTDK